MDRGLRIDWEGDGGGGGVPDAWGRGSSRRYQVEWAGLAHRDHGRHRTNSQRWQRETRSRLWRQMLDSLRTVSPSTGSNEGGKGMQAESGSAVRRWAKDAGHRASANADDDGMSADDVCRLLVFTCLSSWRFCRLRRPQQPWRLLPAETQAQARKHTHIHTHAHDMSSQRTVLGHQHAHALSGHEPRTCDRAERSRRWGKSRHVGKGGGRSTYSHLLANNLGVLLAALRKRRGRLFRLALL